MTPATARRIPAPFSVLTALAALALSAPLALVGAPGHAAPLADDSDTQFKITADIVINKDDTYSAKMVIVDNTDIGFMSEDNCSDDMFAGQDLGKNAKATFKDNGDSRTCTIEGSQSIKDSKGQVKHEGNEYIVKTGSESTSAAMSEVDVTQTITFPGKVTEADGGKVKGEDDHVRASGMHGVLLPYADHLRDSWCRTIGGGQSCGYLEDTEDHGSITVGFASLRLWSSPGPRGNGPVGVPAPASPQEGRRGEGDGRARD